jgi:hypothetical protein
MADGIDSQSEKVTFELDLSDDQIERLHEIAGVKLTRLRVEAEPFEDPPLGTPVLGKVFVDPRTRVTARMNARFLD